MVRRISLVTIFRPAVLPTQIAIQKSWSAKLTAQLYQVSEFESDCPLLIHVISSIVGQLVSKVLVM